MAPTSPVVVAGLGVLELGMWLLPRVGVFLHMIPMALASPIVRLLSLPWRRWFAA